MSDVVHRLLILTPFGKDASHLSKIFRAENLAAVACTDVDHLIEEFQRGAGAIITTEEALTSASGEKLVKALTSQAPWSDIPVVVFFSEGNSFELALKRSSTLLASVSGVRVLQRPVASGVLFSTVRTALRDRERQYKIRDLLQRLESDIVDKESYGRAQSAEREKSDEASRMKSQFLTNMSHEIRTPLGAIMGFLDLIKNPSSTQEEVSRYVEIIDRNSLHLMRLIDDILDLSKVEAGKMEVERVEFSLEKLLADFSALMRFKAQEKGVLFDLQLKGAIPEKVISDPVRVRQVLTNAVGNAIKFTERGRVQLVCSIHDDELRFVITDTGRGMTAQESERLFQPFTQADASTTRLYGGTGLGLVLSRKICQQMGGDFRLIHSEPGGGSAFEASFKVSLSQGSELMRAGPLNAARPEPKSQETQKLTGLRVLLVEDSPDNQALLRVIIQKLGAKIDIASNGQEGVEMALAHPYDVVLMDVQMPYMDGHEATRKLRARGYDVPIIALTAHAMNEERERTKQSGFTDFLSKPIDRTAMIESLLKVQPRA